MLVGQFDAGRITDRSTAGLARWVGRQIFVGSIPSGARLPTVRAVARQLGVSPATVSSAWRILAREGLIATDGRRGSHVLKPGQRSRPSRLLQATADLGLDLNLSLGFPDSALLPDLQPAMRRAADAAATARSYLDEPILAELRTVLEARWPYPADRLAICNGAMAGIDAAIGTLVSFGDIVAIEEPTFPGIIDRLEAAGAELTPVGVDEQGIVPSSLERAIAAGASMLVCQPRAHNPTGASFTAERLAALHAILQPTDLTVIEDDHSGDISSAPALSFGSLLPDRTIRILGFSKAYGPDLRLAAMSGPGDVIDEVSIRRTLADGWTSRLLQSVVADLLVDPPTQSAVEHARRIYRERNEQFIAALGQVGLTCAGGDGLNIWVPVNDEIRAVATLASAGIGVSPGTPFITQRQRSSHIRVTSGVLVSGYGAVADAIAMAATDDRSRPHSR